MCILCATLLQICTCIGTGSLIINSAEEEECKILNGNKENLNKFSGILISKIPKIFHQIWFDFGKGNGKTIPQVYKNFTETLLELHSGWKLMLWDEERVEELLGKFYPELLPIWLSYDVSIKRHDSARIFILHHLGGVYLDHDFMPIKNIEPLIENYQFIIGREEYTSFLVANGFIGAQKIVHF